MSIHSIAPKITVLVPTFNRHAELRRLLVFLREIQNPFALMILDGSAPDGQKANREWIEGNLDRFGFPVQWQGFPSELHQGKRYAAGLEQVSTPYVLICPDDDFFLPEGIAKCVAFLEANADYSIALGYTPCLLHHAETRIFRFGLAVSDKLPNTYHLNHSTFLERYTALLAFTSSGCPPLFYGVRRTVQSREIFRRIDRPIKYSSQEGLNNGLCLVWGKAKVLPEISHFRDYGIPAIREPLRDDPNTYITEEDTNWLRNTINKDLCLTAGCSEPEARKITERAFPFPLTAPAPLRPEPLYSAAHRCLAVFQRGLFLFFPSFFAAVNGLDREAVRSLRIAQRELRAR